MEAAADLGLDRSSPDVMEISGDRGGRISRVEELSRGKAGVGLTLQFRSGIACGVGLEGRRLGVNANFEAMEISRCSTGRGPDDEESADVGWGEHLAGLQVCSSRSEPLTVGGFEIEMAEVDAEGVHSHRTKETGFDGALCDRWESWSSCDEGSVATGLVAHFAAKERGSDLPESLVGLQLVCRPVLVTE